LYRVFFMRILYFGMFGAFSRIPLQALIRAGLHVCGVVVPSTVTTHDTRPLVRLSPPQPAPIPLTMPESSRTIADLALERAIPVFEARQLNAPETLHTIANLQPDVACVACFPWRIPASLLALPTHGFLNLHPSLLPAYRGPEPLFWVLRAGAEIGVTVHFMDEGLDTGDIAAQAPIELPDGVSGTEAERRCADLGGRLLCETLAAISNGTLQRKPQPPGGSFYGHPTQEDFTISVDWPARRAFNFMRGTAEWGCPYPVRIGAARLLLSKALAYDANERLNVPYLQSGRDVRIQFTPGVLYGVEVSG
jgi:methionyl-tRNA formyltransferase